MAPQAARPPARNPPGVSKTIGFTMVFLILRPTGLPKQWFFSSFLNILLLEPSKPLVLQWVFSILRPTGLPKQWFYNGFLNILPLELSKPYVLQWFY